MWAESLSRSLWKKGVILLVRLALKKLWELKKGKEESKSRSSGRETGNWEENGGHKQKTREGIIGEQHER